MAIKTINRVFSVIDAKKNLENLLDFVLFKEKFVSYAKKKYSPATIKSYFTSLGHFYSFFLSEKPDEIPVSSELVTQVKERVRRWSSSYKRSSLQRKWERQEEEGQYTLLRDFLLVQILIDSANRAGVLASMTVKEFTVANVREHKTFHIHGHAHVVLTSNLHNWMNVFIQEVRSQVPGIGVDENQPVFPSFNGTKMQSS